ncbi:hypothetical protein XCR1_2330001 [Xenorhabdus cabanillasii JM26]|uniref:Uncharacterized protein n=1 Tax=Xenorhabdus cabanillasii JM26 TaxID=1427517 RepID=W1J4W4_9GAMM|nr:hypothetical protein XCR1_2330001 [Xenorhabdus cabanillasii JM26]
MGLLVLSFYPFKELSEFYPIIKFVLFESNIAVLDSRANMTTQVTTFFAAE